MSLCLLPPSTCGHVCAQLKTFIDRMHPMLTYDQEHCLTNKRLVFLAAYFAQDPYGAELVIKGFASITGWAGMQFDVIAYHSPNHVREDAAKLTEVYELGQSFSGWQKPQLKVQYPITGCGFQFPDLDRLAMHLVMAAGDSHLDWKAEHLSAIHTLENTQSLKHKSWLCFPR